MQGAGWAFDFPTDPAANVNCVLDYTRRPLTVGQTLTAMCKVTGGGFTPWESPGSPALVSMFIQRRGDDFSGQGQYQGYRWYSKPLPLAAGDLTLSATLTAGDFSDVAGQHDPAAFAAALADMECYGIIFGWEAGRAHGVYGAGTFTLKQL